MLKYLVILLDDTSVAYCHADNPVKSHRLISINDLNRGIVFGMKENLMIQFVFPNYQLPEEYKEVIESIDNIKIFPLGHTPSTGVENDGEAFVEVTDEAPRSFSGKNLVLRLPLSKLLDNKNQVADLFSSGARINICITDVEKFSDESIAAYKSLIEQWSSILADLYRTGHSPQVNLLTDRLMLDTMRNCDAGVSSITLAPNGRFYLCPAFYYDEIMQVDNQMNHTRPSYDYSVGDLDCGLSIENPQLLRIENAPLCRDCDAYHCRRCIWLNHKLTWDNNTPSRQQCIMAHIERNATRGLLRTVRKFNDFMPSVEISEIDYLDPFDVRKMY